MKREKKEDQIMQKINFETIIQLLSIQRRFNSTHYKKNLTQQLQPWPEKTDL